MPPDVTSKHLANATELTLVADVLPGFVETLETRRYGTRIALLLRTLFAIRAKAIEASRLESPYQGPLEKLQALHFVRWSLLDEGRQLMLAVTFDGPWEPYMRRIVDVAGPLLDVILCSCQGYDAAASDNGYGPFVRWVREHQREVQFFHADAPELTADDLRFLRRLESLQRQEPNLEKFDETAAKLRVEDLSQPTTVHPNMSVEDSHQTWQAELGALEALYRLVELFPNHDPTRGHLHLLRTAHLILPRLEDTPVPPLFEKAHARALEWYRSLEPREEKATAPTRVRKRKTIQGNILAPYPEMTHGCLALLRIADRTRARAALRNIARNLTHAAKEPGDQTLNAAFTFQGLRTLGLSEAELASLPQEFREGMEARAGSLGDLGRNHPDHWQRPQLIGHGKQLAGSPVDLDTVDVVLMLQKHAPARRWDQDLRWHAKHPLKRRLDSLLQDSGLDLLAVEVQRRELPKDGYFREHFGFRDGISQPKPEGYPTDPDTVSLGEIVLGYPNDRGDDGKLAHDFLENGSFLVVRKLEQHVERFRKILDNHSDRRERQDQLAARMMGRLPDGRPLVDDALPPDANDFVYDRDRNTPCPPSAHIRRANPRTPRPPRSLAGTQPAPIPRIMRRGFSYGPRYERVEAPVERGLFFMAYNASIAEQFEVLQRWMSGGNSSGALSTDSDPFLGQPRPGSPERVFRSVVGSEVERVSLGKHPLVSLRWGMYLFVPSTEAFRKLADRLPPFPSLPEGDAERGEKLIGRLEFLHAVERLRDPARKPGEPRADDILRSAWKGLIEDIAAQEQAQDMWAAVRARGGAVRTPYGVLLGSEAHVMRAFREYQTFSVREYWDRMRQSIGGLYLGMDEKPQPMLNPPSEAHRELDERYRKALRGGRYDKESALPNAFIQGISGRNAFVAARKTAQATLTRAARTEFGDRAVLDLRRIVGDVFAELSRSWFALPDGQHMRNGGPVPDPPSPSDAHCPDNFLATARYIFSPHPTPHVVEEGRRKGRAIYEASLAYVEESYQRASFPKGTLFEQMAAAHPNPSKRELDLVARALVGSVHGFVGPCYGTVVSVLYLWTVRSRQLWSRQTALAWDGKRAPKHRAFYNLAFAFLATMQLRPLPYILHRTVTKAAQLVGSDADGRARSVALDPGDRAVLGLLSGTRQRPPNDPTLLFGGSWRSAPAATHACPGQELAMGAMLGFLWALLEFGPYEGSGAPLVLSTPARR